MSPRVDVDVSRSVWQAIREDQKASGEPLARVVERALSKAYELDHHTLFQVSTSNALVQGVFTSAITVADLKRHGDFGLGTFDGLDGELVMVDGVCYRATGGGAVTLPDDQTGVPFAVITRFRADRQSTIDTRASYHELTESVDDMRPSENLFVGVRADGWFQLVAMRAACPALPGEGLVEAVRHQSEFEMGDVEGTLVGFWAPLYTRSINVSGYHFHFISADRSIGGHVLDLEAGPLDLGIHVESELHVAIPETAEFLAADLSGDHQREVDLAETKSQR